MGPRKPATDFRPGQTLGEKDHLVELTKPNKKPHWMTQAPNSYYSRAKGQWQGGKVAMVMHDHAGTDINAKYTDKMFNSFLIPFSTVFIAAIG